MRLAVDIDGTLTRGDGSGALDPRVLDALRDVETVVVCTGKVLPNATALCNYAGIPLRVVAENGGLVFVDDELHEVGDGDAAGDFAADFGDMGWGRSDLVNRWRETERAVALDAAERDEVERVASRYGLVVVDTGYAYHVKSPDIDKGSGLVLAADELGYDASEFVAVGDSENDVELLETAGTSYAVGNADAEARAAADHVTDATYADGFLEAVEREG